MRRGSEACLSITVHPKAGNSNAIDQWCKKLKYQLMPADAWERFITLLRTLTTKLVGLGEVNYTPSLHRFAE